MQEFSSIIAALGPVFALVILGYVLGRIPFPDKAFWPQAERLTYFILFPALLVLKIGNAELPSTDLARPIMALIALLLFSSALILWLAHMLKYSPATLTSVFQGGIRFNTYVGLASATALFGDIGMVWGAVFLAIMIPLVNVVCIVCFALWLPKQSQSLGRSLWRGVAKNPLILACLTGGVLNLTGWGIPSPIAPVLGLLSAMALPLGLLAVGVGLNLKMLTQGSQSLWLSTLFKLLVYPVIFMGIAMLFKLPSEATAVLLVFALLPTAPSAYILARQLDGDAPLMATIITLQTLLAMITMPLMLTLFAR